MQTIVRSRASSSARHQRAGACVKTSLLCAALAAAIGLAAAAGTAQAASFTYHGTLQDGAQPAEGKYDLELTLYSAAVGGSVVGGPIDLNAVPVHEGHFSTQLDFGVSGTPANGAYLAVKVRPAGQGSFVALDQRSALSGDSPSSVCPGAWTIDGNAGNPPGSYLGTADAQDLVLEAGGANVAAFSAVNAAAVLGPFASASGRGANSIALGFTNGAAGDNSVAAGFNASTSFLGSFVWGDFDDNPITDTAADQFVVQAGGGVMFNTNQFPYPYEDVVIAPRSGSGSDADADLAFITRSGAYNGDIYVSDSTGVMTVYASNGVHISNPVSIDGTLKSASLEVLGNASKSTAGGFSANSDRRIKQDIEPIDNALDTIQQLRPVTFRYSDAYRASHPEIADQRYYNVIAQEFAQVFPDAVHGSGEYLAGAAKTPDNEILQVDTYPALITTVAAVQQLATDDETTTQRVHHLETENAALKAQLDRLSARLDQLSGAKGN